MLWHRRRESLVFRRARTEYTEAQTTWMGRINQEDQMCCLFFEQNMARKWEGILEANI